MSPVTDHLTARAHRRTRTGQHHRRTPRSTTSATTRAWRSQVVSRSSGFAWWWGTSRRAQVSAPDATLEPVQRRGISGRPYHSLHHSDRERTLCPDKPGHLPDVDIEHIDRIVEPATGPTPPRPSFPRREARSPERGIACFREAEPVHPRGGGRHHRRRQTRRDDSVVEEGAHLPGIRDICPGKRRLCKRTRQRRRREPHIRLTTIHFAPRRWAKAFPILFATSSSVHRVAPTDILHEYTCHHPPLSGDISVGARCPREDRGT